MKKKEKTPTQKKAKRNWLRRVLDWTAALIVAGAIGWVALFFVFAPELPDTTKVWDGSHSPRVTVLAADGIRLAERGAVAGRPVAIDRMPGHLIEALIATEDRRFYEHFGVDLIGLARAMTVNLKAGGIVQGGSTITQQLAKNLYLTPERSFIRKIEELILAIWLEARLSKDEILTLYLNRIYFGAGAYGIESASHLYFDKPTEALNLSEAALLAGLPKAPSRYAPTRNLKLAHQRASQVLANMVDAGYLNDQQAARARRNPAQLAPRLALQGSEYFVDWVLDQLPEDLAMSSGDLTVATTLEPQLQRIVEAATAAALEREGKIKNISQAAVVILDASGAVLAMVGGRSYRASRFNRAAEARRQPGSAFKTFVYLAGMESGLRPGSTLVDEPITIEGWSPRNYNGRHRGRITLNHAFAASLNTIPVLLQERLGRNKVIEAARRLGIASTLKPVPSLALGTNETTLIELTAAYTPFMNGGRHATPYGLLQVSTAWGTTWRHPGWAGQQIIDRTALARMQTLLAEVVASGTGQAARLNGSLAAGKTGTSQDNRDAWFIGFTGALTIGVWVGNDDNTPMLQVTGGGTPARLWKAIASKSQSVRIARRSAPPIPRRKEDVVERFFDWIFAGSDPGPVDEEVKEVARDGLRWVLDKVSPDKTQSKSSHDYEEDETRGR